MDSWPPVVKVKRMNPPLRDGSSDPWKKDRDQVRLLAIFHFILGALALLGIAFLFLHYSIMRLVFMNPEAWKTQPNTPAPPMPPQQLFEVMLWFYLFAGVMITLAFALNLLSGFCLWRRKHRLFSLVIAGLNCLQIPLGTVLGVFTIIVLVRDSTRELYERS
jgi:hypothetical protein